MPEVYNPKQGIPRQVDSVRLSMTSFCSVSDSLATQPWGPRGNQEVCCHITPVIHSTHLAVTWDFKEHTASPTFSSQLQTQLLKSS